MVPPNEKTCRRGSSLISLPYWLGKTLDFFKDNLRPILMEKREDWDKVEGMWINQYGNPAGI